MVKLVHCNLKKCDEKVLHLHLQYISFKPEINYTYDQGRIEFKGICLKQDSVSFLHGNLVNLYISYKLDTWWKYLNIYFTLGNCLFEVVKLIRNVDSDKYGYGGYGIGFDAHVQFSWSDGSWAMGSCVDVDDKNKDILVLGKGPKGGLDDTLITAEAK